MNPSNPEVYYKLIQCCKYFFEANPILVAATMTDNVTCCDDDYCIHAFPERCRLKMDITKITSKIWITHCLTINQKDIPNVIALLRPKVYRCDIHKLEIDGGIVDFDDFKFVALSAKWIDLKKTQIVSNNGSPAMLENILEVIPNFVDFDFSFEKYTSMVSSSTAKNISKLKNLENLQTLSLWDLPQAFCLEDFCAFMKDHSDVWFLLEFPDVSEERSNQLDQFFVSSIGSQLKHVSITLSY